MLVAIPTAMPAEPLTSRLGKRAGEDPGAPSGSRRSWGPSPRCPSRCPGACPRRSWPSGPRCTGRRRGVPIHRAEVAVALDEGVAHGEVLGQADQGVIHGTVPMGVVLTQHIAYAGGGFLEGFVGGQATLVHGVQDSPVDGLQAVPHIGQGPAHDDGHGVVDVAVLHLLDQLGLHDVLVGEGDVLRAIVFVFCHSFTPLSPP